VNLYACTLDRFVFSDKLPKKPGLYAIFFGKVLLYIGQTKNLRARASTHLCVRRTQGCINYFPAPHIPVEGLAFSHFLCSDQKEREDIERYLIAHFNPPFNRRISSF